MKGTSIQYSEAFKREVVKQIERGKYRSVDHARRAYGIRGAMTVSRWVRKYGSEALQTRRIRIQMMKEVDELKAARRRVRELETALADAHIDQCLEHAFLEIACERMGVKPEEFKKKHAMTLSDVRRMRERK